MVLGGSASWGQDAASAENTASESAENTASESAENTDEGNGKPLLDEAFELKLGAQRITDLDKVVDLLETALQRGLDEGDAQFARQLTSSTLLEKAMHIVGPVLQGQLDMTWNQRRRLALTELEHAIEVNPDDGEAHLVIAELHHLPGGDLDKGVASARKAEELLTEDSERHAQALVVLASYQEDPAERVRLYDKALISDDRNFEAWRERGKAKFELGQIDEALQDLAHVLEINSDDTETLQAMAGVFASQEKYDEAIEQANRMIDLAEEEVAGYLVRSRIYLAQGDIQKAEADLDRVLELSPRDLAALLTRARLRQTREDYAGALQDVDRLLQLRPGLPQAILLRSLLYVSTEQYSRAIDDVRTLLRGNPENVELRLQLAGIYAADERPRKAVEIYNEILSSVQDSWQALRGRADAFLSLGQHKEAIEDYERALALQPDNSGMLNNFAWVLATSPVDAVRNGQRAVELAKKACEATEYKAPHILSTLAAGYAELGDFEQAKQWASKAVELADESIREQLLDELKHYEQGKPFRELQTSDQQSQDDAAAPNADDLRLEPTSLPTPRQEE